MRLAAVRRTFALLAFLSLSLCLSAAAGAPQASGEKKGKPRFTNRLARETSPYLLMHAHNPVDWYPWGEEAFAKARKENKLIFLSIGYSSCYWCHVMERESFQNEEVAKLLNKHFVSIKVDREERPDIDQVYLTAVTIVQKGRAGWPLSVFLTPDGKPVFGGTYWPREDRVIEGEKYVGFKTILARAQEIWTKDPQGILKQGDALARMTRNALDAGPPGIALVELDRKLVEGAVETIRERFDPIHGGFGSPPKFSGPKFPMPSYLLYLLRVGERTKNGELIGMVTLTLDKMAQGGICDQLGGGFHRYSTERTWTVPHFEKMLYDNAQLVEAYAHAYRLTKKPLYRRVLHETLGYVLREMTAPAGGFYSSQDAETHHEEGRFYVWTEKELQDALPANEGARLFRKVYGLDGKPNFEGKYHILTLPKLLPDVAKELKLTEAQLDERLAPVRQRLLEVRGKRDRPFRNEVMLTGWSGQMIAGFAEAGRTLKEKKYLDAAARGADFVLKHQKTKDGRLLRTYGAQPGQAPKAQGAAYLEDYAFLAHGLLNLHAATGEKKWLAEARALTDAMVKHHGEEKAGGYYFTSHDHEKLFARHKDQHDGAQPAGNSMALQNLARLWVATGEERYRKEAAKGFRSFAGSLQAHPAALTTRLHALDIHLDRPKGK
ncbi:MAG: thioredoxin domain-containing protein [Gemmataceae bacterium]|nr:thioredoxin domain-containing protein [Gemmataceae bacterium]